MSKIRINDLARELEVKSKAILDVLVEVGVTEKKTHSSSVEEHEAEKVRAHFRAAEAQAAPAKSRAGREADEIKTKIDLSHISKPGDVLKLITKQQQTAATPAPPPVRPPAPPAEIKAAVPPAPSATPPAAKPAPAAAGTAFHHAADCCSPRGESARPTGGTARASGCEACSARRRGSAGAGTATSSSSASAAHKRATGNHGPSPTSAACGLGNFAQRGGPDQAIRACAAASAHDRSANRAAACLQGAAAKTSTARCADRIPSCARPSYTWPANFSASASASSGRSPSTVATR